MTDQHSVKAITAGQEAWVRRIHAAFGTPFDDIIEPDDYARAPDGIVRVFLNGLVFVCTPDGRCAVNVHEPARPPADFKDQMVWRDEHGLDGSYEATRNAYANAASLEAQRRREEKWPC